MPQLFWLSESWSIVEPLLPNNQPGAGRVDDRRVLGSSQSSPVEPTGRKAIRHDRRRYKQRWRVEATIGQLKDFRRVATRYDKLARTCLDTVTLTAIYMFWM